MYFKYCSVFQKHWKSYGCVLTAKVRKSNMLEVYLKYRRASYNLKTLAFSCMYYRLHPSNVPENQDLECYYIMASLVL